MGRRGNGKRPQNLGFTLRALLRYMGRHSLLILTVGILAAISAVANLLGTYMIRPVVNSLAGGDWNALVRGVVLTAAIYGLGVLSAFGYTQVMVRAAESGQWRTVRAAFLIFHSRLPTKPMIPSRPISTQTWR